MENQPMKKLYRSKTDRMIFGVCGGLGEYFNVDSLIFRALFLLLSFGGGAGVLIYLLMAILIPVDSGSHDNAVHHDHKEALNDFAQQVKTGAQNLAHEFKSNHGNTGRRGLVGVIVVIVGCLLLLNVIFPQNWVRWDLFWPVVLIVIGLIVIAKKS